MLRPLATRFIGFGIGEGVAGGQFQAISDITYAFDFNTLGGHFTRLRRHKSRWVGHQRILLGDIKPS
ncbi:Uncharacterised protein [Vibrio cholerae]|nr:Uncharacterised protein [Vibrio cholerae]